MAGETTTARIVAVASDGTHRFGNVPTGRCELAEGLGGAVRAGDAIAIEPPAQPHPALEPV